MRARERTPRRQLAGLGGALLLLLLLPPLLVGCGSRGAPLPPVYPNPPAMLGLTVAQRGSFAILRFPAPLLSVQVGSEDVELEEVLVLLYAERYPVITADILIAALDRRSEVMSSDAAAEALAAAARAVQQAAVAEATAAGLAPPTPDPDAPLTAVRRRGLDEDLIHRMPPEVLLEWRRQGLAEDAVLAAAQRLVNDVNLLWTRLGLPTMVLDPDQSVLLPDAGTIAAASAEMVEAEAYERPLAVGAFLGRASVSRRIPVEQFETLRTDTSLTANPTLQVAIPLGTPSTGALRTRYFFAVRGSSTRQTPGLVTALVALAPIPVPVAPANVGVVVGADGVELTWDPPPGDLALRRLDPAALRYNVYRMLPGEIASANMLNPTPLSGTTFTDRGMRWGETYVYEVRALSPATSTLQGALAPAASTLLRESEGAKTLDVQVIDQYPPAPPTNVNAARVGNRVPLQWTPSVSIDLIGYRVYRHPFPAPSVPQRFDPTAPEDESGEAGATAPEPTTPVAVTPVATTPVATTPAQGEPDAPADNEMVDAGWELLTTNPVPFSRFTDSTADPSVRYVYAVEAIDAAGNLSALALGTEPGDNNR